MECKIERTKREKLPWELYTDSPLLTIICIYDENSIKLYYGYLNDLLHFEHVIILHTFKSVYT